LLGARIVETVPGAQTVCVVATRGKEVLLLRRISGRGGFWQPVTGRVEPGEGSAAAAARELAEETGARGEVKSLDYVHAFPWGETLPPTVTTETAYATRWPGGEVQVDPAEHDAFAWLPAAEAIAKVPFAGLKEAIRRASAR
jgi:lipoyl(octanoyl) transferase